MGSEAFMRPCELKKLEHEARCTLLDAEHSEFVALVGLMSTSCHWGIGSTSANYVRIRLRQPETEQRLHRLPASVFRVLMVHFPDLALQVEHKGNTHACYTIWSGQVSTRVGVKMGKASGTRSEVSGDMWLWAQGWGPALDCIHHAPIGSATGGGVVFWHLHEDARCIL